MGVKLLLFLDATWRFAQEMLKSSPALQAVRKVELRAPTGASPQFLVRKPVRLDQPAPTETADAGDASGSDDCNALGDGRWGFCTAEAVALAVDAVNVARHDDRRTCEASTETKAEDCPGPAWEAVGAVVRGHVEMQLSRTRQVRHRPDRPGYVPGLYESVQPSASSATVGSAPDTALRAQPEAKMSREATVTAAATESVTSVAE